jgi:hypothetical protein
LSTRPIRHLIPTLAKSSLLHRKQYCSRKSRFIFQQQLKMATEQSSKPSTALFDVFLRLRPSNAPSAERFLDVEAPAEGHPTHITIRPPSSDHRKRAVEKFAFTRVFEEDTSQLNIFKDVGVLPLIEGVLGAEKREGRDGLLATLGVTGSGKV